MAHFDFYIIITGIKPLAYLFIDIGEYFKDYLTY